MSLRSTFSSRAIGLTFAAGAFFGMAATALTADVLGSTVFRDVPAGSYYDLASGRMQAAGIMKGMPDGTFHPGDFVTRAELVTVIDRVINGGVVSEPSPSPTPPPPPPPPSSSTSSTRSRSSSSKSSSSSVTARSDAGAFQFTTGAFSISNKASNLSVSVMRTGGAKGAVGVKYTFSGGTAVAEKDYNPATGTIEFKDGETSKLLSLRVLNSGQPGSPTTVNLKLHDPTGGAVLGSPSAAVITILNGNAAGSTSQSSSYSTTSSAPGGTMSFAATAYSVAEPDGTIAVTVKRAGSTSLATTIDYATSDGTAKSGTHYVPASGTLSFAVGESAKTFNVSVSNNSDIGGNKTLTLTLKNATGNANIGYPSTATLTIMDDEANVVTSSGSLQFPSESFVVGEPDGIATILVTRSGGSKGTVTVNYATSDGSAISGGDYVTTSGTLTFAPGESSKYFTVTINRDSVSEGEDMVNLTLSSPTGGAVLGTQNTASLKIRD